MNVNSVTAGLDVTSRMLESGSLLDQVQSLRERAGELQTPESLQKVARDFESVFMSLVLKQLRESLDMSEDGSGGLFPSDKSGSLGGIFDMFLSQHLAENSSLGVGDMIQQYLANQAGVSADEDALTAAVSSESSNGGQESSVATRVDIRR